MAASGPYIVTTTTPEMASTTRRAVATLEEAREQTERIVLGVNARGTGLRSPAAQRLHPDARQVVWFDLRRAIAHLPEPGGTVGPLPDGTLIEVSQASWDDLLRNLDISDEEYERLADTRLTRDADVLAAYNAEEARRGH